MKTMMAAHIKMIGHGPLLANFPVKAPMRPCSCIISKAAAKRPLMDPDAPMTGLCVVGLRMKKKAAPKIPQRKKKRIVVLVENMRSTNVPRARHMTALKPICVQSLWMKLYVIGVSRVSQFQLSVAVKLAGTKPHSLMILRFVSLSRPKVMMAWVIIKAAVIAFVNGGILPKLKKGSFAPFFAALCAFLWAFFSACCFLRMRSRSARVGNFTTLSGLLSLPFGLLFINDFNHRWVLMNMGFLLLECVWQKKKRVIGG